jgi:hypothetical protein
MRNPFKKKEEKCVGLRDEHIPTGSFSRITVEPQITLQKVKHLDLLLKHFLYLIYTAFLKDEDAVSGLIYAWQERGKSTIALSVEHTGLLIEDDITAYGLARRLNELSKDGKLKQFHHLLIADLEKVSSRTRTVKNELRSFLQTLMFDGVQRIDTYNIHLDLPKRLKMAVIACVTPDIFNEKSAFRRLGFLSRLIPFSFDYTDNVIYEIIKFIGTLEEDRLRIQTIKVLTRKKAEVAISPLYLSWLDEKAKTLAKTIDDFCPYKKADEQRLIGSRAKKLLTCYVKAIALEMGKSSVDEAVWQEFETMFGYFNFDMKELP